MMVTYFKKYFGVVSLLCIMALTAGCSSDSEGPVETACDGGEKSMPMLFCGDVEQFDSGMTRGMGWQWQNGAVVYIQFHTDGADVVRGYAQYDGNKWEVFYSGQLSATGTCEVYFFDGASAADKRKVTLNGTNGVYATKDGAYTVENGTLVVNASLAPMTGRIRFKGDSGVSIKLSGISVYAGYDAESNKFNTVSTPVDLGVNSDGFTPYLYCMFADAGNRTISIVNSIDGYYMVFSRTCDQSVLRTGESGIMTIPTEDTNKGWVATKQTTITFTAGGVTFDMKLVEAGTFSMGSSTGESDESPIQTVTISKDYYMGETEVTQALWKAVTGYSPIQSGSSWSSTSWDWDSTYGAGDDYPAYNISYDDVLSFITKLNSMSGAKFRMPTEAEWEFAARGGNKSKGYTYSGGNTIGDVAWYSSNSGRKSHPVKGKQANELGLYDMSGNVFEWCSDWYGTYSSVAQTDPSGPASGSYRVRRGGSWDRDALYCLPSERYGLRPDVRLGILGFRLALSE